MAGSFVKALCRAFYFFVHPLRVEGKETLPESGAYILALNHQNFRDAIVGLLLTRDDARTMAKKELFENRFTNAFFRHLGAFPVDRGNVDMAALRLSMQMLSEGHPLVIFPEGHRFADGEIHEIKGGAILIAMRTGAPIYPARIRASYRPFSPVKIRIGSPMTVDRARGSDALTEGAEALKKRMEEL